MKFLFLCLVTSFCFVNSAQATLRETMVGETQTEREVRWIWKHLKFVADSCLRSPDCSETQVRSVVEALASYLPMYNSSQARQWASLLNFVSEKEHPEIFTSEQGESHRIVMTGLAKYSPVYINTDRMHLQLEVLVGLMAHEAVHHLGFADDEQRLPDLVGSALAKHFKSQIQYSSLEQFNLPDNRFVIFNSLAGGESISFASWAGTTTDVAWDSNPMQPLCGPQELLSKEYVSAPSWKAIAFSVAKSVVQLRGGGVVQIECKNKMTGSIRQQFMPIDAGINLQYPAPFDFSKWQEQIPTPIFASAAFSPSYNMMDHMFGAAQTFVVVSQTLSHAQISAGETLRVEMILQGTEKNFRPARCALQIAGTQYSVITQDHLPGVNPFRSCQLTALANNQWKVEGELVFPQDTRPDLYYVPIVKLSQPGPGDRTAIPTVPKFVKLENASAAAAPAVSSLRILGLSPAKTLGTWTDLTNSYLAPVNKIFTVEFDVIGLQNVSDLWFDMQLWYPGENEFGIANGSGSSGSIPQVFLKTEFKRSADRTTVVMTFRMPANIQGIPIVALKFQRFYLRTSDFSWTEIEMPGMHEAMVVSPNWGT